MIANERFGLVYAKTGSINSGTGVFHTNKISKACLYVLLNRVNFTDVLFKMSLVRNKYTYL
jgi:hypothetical protein